MNPPEKSSPQGGFTFIEVLAALGVAAIAFTVLLQTDAINHRRVIQAQMLSGAVHLGETKMHDLYAQGVPSLTEDRGEEGVYEWTRTITETMFPGVSEVVVSVSWPEGSERRNFNVAAYLPQ